ncbi:MAG: DEAD/DEAH box helicase [Elusimicrobia bacterium]|nr:DEAD/DEAH box helicase [Elusimicrobiota bacterium]
MNSDDINTLTQKLENSLQECNRLKEENERLKKQLAAHQALSGIKERKIEHIQNKSSFSQEEKIRIFLKLFRGREDVFAIRWVSRKGKSGYSPSCANEWDNKLCHKPHINCSECHNRKYLPITNEIVYNHLSGKKTIGIYPLLSDETCWFLAVDFDGSSWQNDASTYLAVCNDLNISAALERSRSGNGCHVWIFFEENVPAALARKLGAVILSKALENRYQIGFRSYDRFFPNQDTMPKGGFGNLIALPLQKAPRENGNSVFLTPDFKPFPDQWDYLSSVKKLSFRHLSEIIDNNRDIGTLGEIRTVADPDKPVEDDPWTLPPSKKKKIVFDTLPEKIRVVLGNLIYIEKKDSASKVIKHLLSIAAFQNPEFYKAQMMRLSTFGKPRIIACGEDKPESGYIALPRGCLDDLMAFFKEYKIEPVVEDQRLEGNRINVEFEGELRPMQQEAVKIVLKHDIGIVSAGTAFGKTVLAANIIARRRVNTIVLVHRKQLLEQWVKMLSAFLNIPEKNIGKIGGGKNKVTGVIDVAIIQSLFRKGIVKDFVADYGQVIVDECHHVSAFSFEQVMREVKGKYVLGLTATPIRKDGHHPIIIMQCGPIRFRVAEKQQAIERAFEHLVIPRHTDFQVADDSEIQIQNLYRMLTQDTARNELIVRDILSSIKTGKSPLLLTERTEHLEFFRTRLEGLVKNIFVFKGGMGRKQFKELNNNLSSLPAGEERIILSTGRYMGEGFDDKRLDVLFLALPVSWRGTLAQYVGRLHRLNDNKKQVAVYDYADVKVPRLKRMYDKRLKSYKVLGYRLTEQDSTTAQISLL